MADSFDCVVVGAGVIGLAVARALALDGRSVVVLEAEADIGLHTSSRNSEVIHAGIYYEKDSLKASLCVKGKAELYRYCETRRIPVYRIGKLIVATQEGDADRLAGIMARAAANDVNDLQLLSAQQMKALEPAVTCHSALLSPSTGIIDSHALMLAIRADLEASGGLVVTNSRVSKVEVDGVGFQLTVEGTEERIPCHVLVNAAGLGAHTLALSIDGLEPRYVPLVRFARGHYFALSGKSPFRHLVYPLPVDGGLGVHVTNDMTGRARFGPDVDWVDAVSYAFDDSRAPKFIEAIRAYYPGLDPSRLSPAYTGLRPKLSGPGEPARDFVIQGPDDHGLEGLVNLFGIESPGLTASLAIGDLVAETLRRAS